MVMVETLVKASDQMGPIPVWRLEKPGSLRDGEIRDRTLIQCEAIKAQ